jgi:hypothetical protein
LDEIISVTILDLKHATCRVSCIERILFVITEQDSAEKSHESGFAGFVRAENDVQFGG